MEFQFFEGQPVILHSLGHNHKGKEYKGFIRGCASNYGLSPATIYIVESQELVKDFMGEYPFSHCTVPSSCIKEDTEQ